MKYICTSVDTEQPAIDTEQPDRWKPILRAIASASAMAR